MTETEQQLRDDLAFVRHAVARRDAPDATPRGILLIWAVYVLVGYALLDQSVAAANWFFLLAGIAGGVASSIIGRRNARRAGQADREEGLRHMLHWGSIFLAIIAIVALAIARRDQLRGGGEIVGQFIALTIGVIYFLAGVHFDRRFIWLGLLLIAGSIAISFVPRYGWTALGIVMFIGLAGPTIFSKGPDDTNATAAAAAADSLSAG
jgi:hypothetical protein